MNDTGKNAVKASGTQNTQQRGQTIEIDLLELLYFYLSRIAYILAALAVGALLTGLVTVFFITPKYTSTAKLYMVSSSSDSIVNLSDLNLGTNLSADYVEVIKIRPIFEDVIEELGLNYDYEALFKMVEVNTVQNTRILRIRVTSRNRMEAAAIANAIARQAVSQVPRLMETSEPHIIEPAIVPKRRSSPSYTKNVLIGGAAGAFLAMLVLAVIFVMDDTIKTPEDVDKLLGVMPLTTIPESDIGILSEKLEHSDKGGRISRTVSRVKRWYRKRSKGKKDAQS